MGQEKVERVLYLLGSPKRGRRSQMHNDVWSIALVLGQPGERVLEHRKIWRVVLRKVPRSQKWNLCPLRSGDRSDFRVVGRHHAPVDERRELREGDRLGDER